MSVSKQTFVQDAAFGKVGSQPTFSALSFNGCLSYAVFGRSTHHIAIIAFGPHSSKVPMASPTASEIAQLNDAFRKGDPSVPGQRLITAGVVHLLHQLEIPTETLIQRVAEFDDFAAANDPHAQHDFGAFEFHGYQLFWKLDYCDVDYSMGSDDPTDLNKTRRMLTIMLADEW